MNYTLRALLVFACALSCAACGGTAAVPTAPTASPAPTVPATPAPPPISASNLTINGFTSLSGKGETGRLRAIVTFSDGSVQDQSSAAQWSSADVNVVTVAESGLVTAVGDGHTIVTATFASLMGTRTVRVDLP